MRKPQRNELGLKAESLCLGVRNAGKVLEANKGNTSAIDDKLTSIRGSHTHH